MDRVFRRHKAGDVGPAKSQKKFLNEKDALQRLKHLQTIIDHLPKNDCRLYFLENRSFIFYTFCDAFFATEQEAKQKVTANYTKDLNCILHVFESILIFLPDAINRRWQFNAIIEILEEILNERNVLVIRKHGTRLFLLWYQILGTNATEKCHRIFSNLVPGFGHWISVFQKRESVRYTIAINAQNDTSSIQSPSYQRAGNPVFGVYPRDPVVLIDAHDLNRDVTQDLLNYFLNSLVSEIESIVWNEQSRERHLMQFWFLFEQLKRTYLPVLFPCLSPQYSIYDPAKSLSCIGHAELMNKMEDYPISTVVLPTYQEIFIIWFSNHLDTSWHLYNSELASNLSEERQSSRHHPMKLPNGQDPETDLLELGSGSRMSVNFPASLGDSGLSDMNLRTQGVSSANAARAEEDYSIKHRSSTDARPASVSQRRNLEFGVQPKSSQSSSVLGRYRISREEVAVIIKEADVMCPVLYGCQQNINLVHNILHQAFMLPVQCWRGLHAVLNVYASWLENKIHRPIFLQDVNDNNATWSSQPVVRQFTRYPSTDEKGHEGDDEADDAVETRVRDHKTSTDLGDYPFSRVHSNNNTESESACSSPTAPTITTDNQVQGSEAMQRPEESKKQEELRGCLQSVIQIMLSNMSRVFLLPPIAKERDAQSISRTNLTPQSSPVDVVKQQVILCRRVLRQFRICSNGELCTATWMKLLTSLLDVMKIAMIHTSPTDHREYSWLTNENLLLTLFQTMNGTLLRSALYSSVSTEPWNQCMQVYSQLTHWPALITEWMKVMQTLTSTMSKSVYRVDLAELPQANKNRRRKRSIVRPNPIERVRPKSFTEEAMMSHGPRTNQTHRLTGNLQSGMPSANSSRRELGSSVRSNPIDDVVETLNSITTTNHTNTTTVRTSSDSRAARSDRISISSDPSTRRNFVDSNADAVDAWAVEQSSRLQNGADSPEDDVEDEREAEEEENGDTMAEEGEELEEDEEEDILPFSIDVDVVKAPTPDRAIYSAMDRPSHNREKRNTLVTTQPIGRAHIGRLDRSTPPRSIHDPTWLDSTPQNGSASSLRSKQSTDRHSLSSSRPVKDGRRRGRSEPRTSFDDTDANGRHMISFAKSVSPPIYRNGLQPDSPPISHRHSSMGFVTTTDSDNGRPSESKMHNYKYSVKRKSTVKRVTKSSRDVIYSRCPDSVSQANKPVILRHPRLPLVDPAVRARSTTVIRSKRQSLTVRDVRSSYRHSARHSSGSMDPSDVRVSDLLPRSPDLDYRGGYLRREATLTAQSPSPLDTDGVHTPTIINSQISAPNRLPRCILAGGTAPGWTVESIAVCWRRFLGILGKVNDIATPSSLEKVYVYLSELMDLLLKVQQHQQLNSVAEKCVRPAANHSVPMEYILPTLFEVIQLEEKPETVRLCAIRILCNAIISTPSNWFNEEVIAQFYRVLHHFLSGSEERFIREIVRSCGWTLFATELPASNVLMLDFLRSIDSVLDSSAKAKELPRTGALVMLISLICYPLSFDCIQCMDIGFPATLKSVKSSDLKHRLFQTFINTVLSNPDTEARHLALSALCMSCVVDLVNLDTSAAAAAASNNSSAGSTSPTSMSTSNQRCCINESVSLLLGMMRFADRTVALVAVEMIQLLANYSSLFIRHLPDLPALIIQSLSWTLDLVWRSIKVTDMSPIEKRLLACLILSMSDWILSLPPHLVSVSSMSDSQRSAPNGGSGGDCTSLLSTVLSSLYAILLSVPTPPDLKKNSLYSLATTAGSSFIQPDPLDAMWSRFRSPIDVQAIYAPTMKLDSTASNTHAMFIAASAVSGGPYRPAISNPLRYIRQAARASLCHLLNHLNHYPWHNKGTQMHSTVQEHQDQSLDTSAPVNSSEFSLSFLEQNNIQLFVINDSILLSCITLPWPMGEEGAAVATTPIVDLVAPSGPTGVLENTGLFPVNSFHSPTLFGQSSDTHTAVSNKQYVRFCMRDFSGKYTWDSSCLYGFLPEDHPACLSQRFPSTRTLTPSWQPQLNSINHKPQTSPGQDYPPCPPPRQNPNPPPLMGQSQLHPTHQPVSSRFIGVRSATQSPSRSISSNSASPNRRSSAYQAPHMGSPITDANTAPVKPESLKVEQLSNMLKELSTTSPAHSLPWIQSTSSESEDSDPENEKHHSCVNMEALTEGQIHSQCQLDESLLEQRSTRRTRESVTVSPSIERAESTTVPPEWSSPPDLTTAASENSMELHHFAACRHFFNQMGLLSFERRPTIELMKKCAGLVRDLKHLDKFGIRETHKIALFFVAAGQEDKQSILANQKASLEFENFVAGLGWEIDLTTHRGFRGGLEQSGRAGQSTAYYATATAEVIFHISTRMSSSEDVKYKHLGNDEVMIIWTENVRAFTRGVLRTQFGDVVIIISPLSNGLFRVEVRRESVTGFFGPIVHMAVLDANVLPGLVRATAINASRAIRAMKPGFRSHYEERANSLKQIISKYTERSCFEDYAQSLVLPSVAPDHQPSMSVTSLPFTQPTNVPSERPVAPVWSREPDLPEGSTGQTATVPNTTTITVAAPPSSTSGQHAQTVMSSMMGKDATYLLDSYNFSDTDDGRNQMHHMGLHPFVNQSPIVGPPGSDMKRDNVHVSSSPSQRKHGVRVHRKSSTQPQTPNATTILYSSPDGVTHERLESDRSRAPTTHAPNLRHLLSKSRRHSKKRHSEQPNQ